MPRTDLARDIAADMTEVRSADIAGIGPADIAAQVRSVDM
jgi:hypothetical protein